MRFEVRHTLAPKQPSVAAGHIYGQFGLDPEQGERVYVPAFNVDVLPGQIIAFIGASGGGKTSCLRQFLAQTGGINLMDVDLDAEKMVIEHFPDPRTALEIAGACGLAEAQLMMRYPRELSDGQRYRFALATAVANGHKVIACDEFLAPLDRVTAKVIAYNLRKLVTRMNLTIAVATTHEDILDDLQPDWTVFFDGGEARVHRGTPRPKGSRFTLMCTLPEALERTGIALRAGTTGVTTWARSSRSSS